MVSRNNTFFFSYTYRMHHLGLVCTQNSKKILRTFNHKTQEGKQLLYSICITLLKPADFMKRVPSVLIDQMQSACILQMLFKLRASSLKAQTGKGIQSLSS